LGRLYQQRFYTNSDFAVALWEGESGDELLLGVDTPMLRSEFASFTICLRGRLRMEKPSGAIGWAYGPGDHSDNGGDFDEVGVYKWTAVEPTTQELCFSRADAVGKETDEVFQRAIHVVDTGAVVPLGIGFAVVVRGSFETSKGVLRAPHFCVLKQPTTFTAAENNSRVIAVFK
jgi:hypothetical protein